MAGENDAKLMYEISKLTNVSRQLSDDFVEAMVYTMFREFTASMPDPTAFMEMFMDVWEESVIKQKEIELAALSNQEGTMMDMAAGAIIANQEDVDKYKSEVAEMKELLSGAVLGGIEDV